LSFKVLFLLIACLGLYQVKITQILRRLLEQSLRTSSEAISSQSGMFALASDCQTRYRNAAERVESVDTDAIVLSEMTCFSAIRLGQFRWTFLQIDDLLQGEPGFLITLGLIGTFSGLIQNMSGLSTLLLTGEEVNLIRGFAAIFPSMGAAFSTSLFGIFLSIFI